MVLIVGTAANPGMVSGHGSVLHHDLAIRFPTDQDQFGSQRIALAQSRIGGVNVSQAAIRGHLADELLGRHDGRVGERSLDSSKIVGFFAGGCQRIWRIQIRSLNHAYAEALD